MAQGNNRLPEVKLAKADDGVELSNEAARVAAALSNIVEQEPGGPGSEAQVDNTAYPWLASLKNTAAELGHHIELFETLAAARQNNEMPLATLTVLDASMLSRARQAGEAVAGFSFDWTRNLERLAAATAACDTVVELISKNDGDDVPLDVADAVHRLKSTLGSTDTLLWDSLLYNVRSRIGKLLLDLAELQKFAVDKYAAGASYAG